MMHGTCSALHLKFQGHSPWSILRLRVLLKGTLMIVQRLPLQPTFTSPDHYPQQHIRETNVWQKIMVLFKAQVHTGIGQRKFFPTRIMLAICRWMVWSSTIQMTPESRSSLKVYMNCICSETRSVLLFYSTTNLMLVLLFIYQLNMLWSLLTLSVYQKGNDPTVKLNVLIKLWWSLFDEVCAAGQLQLAHIVLWKSIRCHCYLLIVRLYLFLYVCVSIVTVLVALNNRTTPSCIENVDLMLFSHFLTSINLNIRMTFITQKEYQNFEMLL